MTAASTQRAGASLETLPEALPLEVAVPAAPPPCPRHSRPKPAANSPPGASRETRWPRLPRKPLRYPQRHAVPLGSPTARKRSVSKHSWPSKFLNKCSDTNWEAVQPPWPASQAMVERRQAGRGGARWGQAGQARAVPCRRGQQRPGLPNWLATLQLLEAARRPPCAPPAARRAPLPARPPAAAAG